MELNRRILAVSKMLLSGKPNKVIFRYASQNWNITSRQTQSYIKASFALWYDEFKVKHKANVSYHLAKRADLYFQAYKQKDWQTCLSIAKDEAKILDVYPSEKQELLIDQKDKDEEIDKIVGMKIQRLFSALTLPEMENLVALMMGKTQEETAFMIRNPSAKGGWKKTPQKTEIIGDLNYVIDKRNKQRKGVKETNSI